MSAISSSFTLPSSKHKILLNPTSSLTPPSQLPSNFGLSYRPSNNRISAKSSLRVSCLGDTKAAAVTGKSWDKLILKSETPVLVEFYASWCGPCRMVHRVIDEIATDYSGKLNCFVLDADQETHIAESYEIKAVPVVLLFKNGEKRDLIVGTMPKEFYVSAIEKAGKSATVEEALVHIKKLPETVQELEKQKQEGFSGVIFITKNSIISQQSLIP